MKCLKKAITFRMLALVNTVVITRLVTGSWKVGGILALAIGAANTITYIIHERMWEHGKGKDI